MKHKKSFSFFVKKFFLISFFAFVIFSFAIPASAFYPFSSLITAYKNFISSAPVVINLPVIKPAAPSSSVAVVGPRGPVGPMGPRGPAGSPSSFAYTFPSTDGLPDQVLRTNGFGTLIWGFAGGGGGGGGGGGVSASSLAGYIPYTGATTNINLGVNNLTVDTNSFFVDSTNHRVGIGTITPAAYLQIKAGTAAAGTAPLKLTSGTLNTTPEAGAIEFDGTSLYYTDSTPTRRTLVTSTSVSGVYVPYTGATTDVNLGVHNFTVDTNTLFVDSVSHMVGIGTVTPSANFQVAQGTAGIGTVSTVGTTDLVGIGTQFLNTFKVGDTITVSGETSRTIDSIIDDTNLTVTVAFSNTASGLTYTLAGGTRFSVFGNGNVNISSGSAYMYNSANVITAQTALNNYFFGGAGNFAMTGTGNIAIGYQSFINNTTGSENTASGHQALINNTLGVSNTANGYQALRANTEGIFNTAVGVQALYSNTINSRNTAIGYQALYFSTGADNTATGLDALYNNTTGIENTATGLQALMNNNAGDENTATGVGALRSNTSGSRNTATGFQALFNNITGTNNVALGFSAGGYETDSNAFYVNNVNEGSTANDKDFSLLYGTFSGTAGSLTNQKLTVNGNLGVNTITPTANFQVAQNITGPGTVSVSGTAVTGVGTQFTNTFKVGDTITVFTTSGTETKAIATITSDTALVTAAFTGTATAGTTYNLDGGARFSVLGNGNVGIGTITPGYKLEVNGSIAASSFVLTDTSGKTIFGNGAGAANTNTDLTAFGKSAAAANSDTGVAVGNTAIGYEALKTNISGHLNVALGYQALKVSLGAGNTAVGGDALSALTTGEHATAVGAHALNHLTIGNGNDAFGYAALSANTIGSNNIAFGVQALTNNIDGDENIAIGYQALLNQTSGGYYNIAIGARALAANIDADYNLAIGRNSLTSLQTGNMNSAIGYGTLTAINGGYYQNTAVGAQALGAKTAGSENTVVGAKAGYSDLTGVQNTVVGNQAGYTMTAGSRNVFLGNYAGYYETGSDKLFIDNTTRASEADGRTKALVYGVFNAAVANQVLTVNGSLGIGTAPSNIFHATGAPATGTHTARIANTLGGVTQNNGLLILAGNDTGVAASELITFQRPDATVIGSVSQNAAATVAFNTSSDRRIKENIAPTTFGLADLLKINVTDFNFLSDPSKQKTTGFIAQELYSIYPGAVTTNGDNGTDTLTRGKTPWMIDYSKLTPLLVKSIQDMNLNLEGIAGTITPLSGSPAESFVTAFYNKMVAWLGEAGNGITKIFTGEVETKSLCVSDDAGAKTCLTKAQLDALLTGTAVSGSGSSGGNITPTPLPVEPAPISKKPILPDPDPIIPITPEPVPTPVSTIPEPVAPAPAPVVADPTPTPTPTPTPPTP